MNLNNCVRMDGFGMAVSVGQARYAGTLATPVQMPRGLSISWNAPAGAYLPVGTQVSATGRAVYVKTPPGTGFAERGAVFTPSAERRAFLDQLRSATRAPGLGFLFSSGPSKAELEAKRDMLEAEAADATGARYGEIVAELTRINAKLRRF